jgi:DNA-binding transcriptional regulator YiaG
MTTFSEKLKAARAAAGLSQSKAAIVLNRSASTLRHWEQSVNAPHPVIQAHTLSTLWTLKTITK